MAAEAQDKKKYQVSPRYAHLYPNSVTLVPVTLTDKIDTSAPTITVALGDKDVLHTIPGTAGNPPVTVNIPAATQAQLAYLYKVERNPHIQEIPA
jgi:hypothetical protein